MRLNAIRFEREIHERHGGDAMNIVVAVEGDALLIHRLEDALDGDFHLRQHGGITEGGELWHQEIANLRAADDATLGEQQGQDGMQTRLCNQLRCGLGHRLEQPARRARVREWGSESQGHDQSATSLYAARN